MTHDDKGAAQTSAVTLPLFRAALLTPHLGTRRPTYKWGVKGEDGASPPLITDQRAAALTSKQWHYFVSMIKNLMSAHKQQSSHEAEQQGASRNQQDE
jgi:hypothetical protein